MICEQKIRIQADNFPSDCEDWRIFESELEGPDFLVNCNISESLPEPEGAFCSTHPCLPLNPVLLGEGALSGSLYHRFPAHRKCTIMFEGPVK